MSRSGNLFSESGSGIMYYIQQLVIQLFIFSGLHHSLLNSDIQYILYNLTFKIGK